MLFQLIIQMKQSLMRMEFFLRYKADTSKYKGTYYIIMIAYVVSVILITYLLYFFKKETKK